MDPNFFQTHINLGRVYARTGRYAESFAELNKAVKLSRGGALERVLEGLGRLW
jgi:hypothetical protein